MEKVGELEALTSNASVLGSTEVTASVSVLVTATNDVSGNITVREREKTEHELEFCVS